MYARTAYLDGRHDVIVDTNQSLTVSCCGTYRLQSQAQFETFRPNGRPDYQLLYIAAGKATFYFDGQPQMLGAGTAVLYRPGESQRYIYRVADKPQVYWLHFTGRDAQHLLHRHGLWAHRQVYVGTSAQFAELFDSIIQELQLCRPLYRQLLPQLLEQLFLLLHRQLLEFSTPGKTLEGEIWEAVSYFQKHYHRPILVADYAKAHHMSSAWFIHRFKQATGLPPMQYLQSLRLNTARGLLEGTDCTISQAAAIAGFSDPLYFSRLFKKRLGISPTEYRKRIEKKDG